MDTRLLIRAMRNQLASDWLPKALSALSCTLKISKAEGRGPALLRFFGCSGFRLGVTFPECSPAEASVEGHWQLPVHKDADSTIVRIVKKGEHDLVNRTGEEREWRFRLDMGKRHARDVSLMLKERHPNLRCLHLSKTPIPAPTIYRLDRRIYKRSITDASPGKKPEVEGGTGRDIWYSILFDGHFPRLAEDAFDDCEYRFAYMFNVPVVKRHVQVASSKRAPSVISFSTNETLIRTSEVLGRDIFERYAGYEVGDVNRNPVRHKPHGYLLGWHLQEGYGVVWNVKAIQNWTLVATFEKGRPL